MLDKRVFAEGMGQLAGAFGREIDGPVSRMYYAILSPTLSTEQFTQAVTRVIASERFWPAPAVILEYAGADALSHAHRAFQLVRETTKAHGGYMTTPHSAWEAFDAATRAAIKAVGGLAGIAEQSGPDQHPKMLRKFYRAYNEAAGPGAALSAGGTMAPEARRLIDGTAKQLELSSGRDRAAGKESE